jgi:hypothetical protein
MVSTNEATNDTERGSHWRAASVANFVLCFPHMCVISDRIPIFITTNCPAHATSGKIALKDWFTGSVVPYWNEIRNLSPEIVTRQSRTGCFVVNSVSTTGNLGHRGDSFGGTRTQTSVLHGEQRLVGK